MREVADPAPVHLDLELAGGGNEQSRAQGEQRRLPRAVRPRDDQQVAGGDVEVEVAEHALRPEAAAKPARGDHTTTSASTKRKKVTLMTPFIVKNAMSSLVVSRGETSECS